MNESTADADRAVAPPAYLFVGSLLSFAAAGALLPAAWRLFSLRGGSTSGALAAFAAALVLGAASGAWRAPRWGRRSAVLYSFLLAAALAVAPLLFRVGGSVYDSVAPQASGSSAAIWLLRFLLASLLVAPAGFLTGRLIALQFHLVRTGGPEEANGRGFAVGMVTAGLGLGLACGGRILLPALGMRGVLFVGLGLSGLGAALGLLGRGERTAADEPRRETAAFPAALLFGFSLWTAFVCWGRTLAIVLGPTDEISALAAAVLLLGASLGALVVAGLPERLARATAPVALTVAGLTIYGSMHGVPWLAEFYLDRAAGSGSWGQPMLLALMLSGMLVLPAAVSGGAAMSILAAGSGVAAAFLGGLAAAGTASLWLIPMLGLRRTLGLAAAVALLAALLRLGDLPRLQPALRAAGVLVLLALMTVVGIFPAAWDPRVIAAGLYRYAPGAVERFGSAAAYLAARQRGGPPLFYREGSEATVVVEEARQSSPGLAAIDTEVLSIDGKSSASTGTDLRTQVLSAEIPMLLRGSPGPGAESVLVIDFLTGIGAGSALRHPVRAVTVIEREPAIVQAGAWFTAIANNPLGDARIAILHDSPRARLLADRARYDVILLSATDPWLAHSAALLTTEGYALLRARLNEGGVVAQRLSLSAAPALAERAILRTFARAFASVLVFQLTPDDLLLVGSDAPHPLDAMSIKSVLASNGGVADDLRRSVIVGPDEVVMTLRLGGDALRRLMGEGPVNDDDHNVVSVMAARDLEVHHNDDIAREIDAAWSGLEGLVAHYGATPSEQSDYLYGLAKSYLGLTADPVRALGVAQQLAGLGETARSRWVTGESRLQQKDIDGALGEWEAVLVADPRNLDALFSLGTFYLDGRDYLRADKYLSRAASLYGDTPVVLYHDGRNQFNLGRYDRAITELQKARTLGGDSHDAYPLVDYFVGLAALRLKRDDLASRSLQDYLKWAYTQAVLTRVEVDAHLKLADVYDRQGKRFEGLQERRKASALRTRIEAYARVHPEAAGGPAPAPEAAPGSDAH